MSLNQEESTERSPLLLALPVKEGNIQLVQKYLIEERVDVNCAVDKVR